VELVLACGVGSVAAFEVLAKEALDAALLWLWYGVYERGALIAATFA
jgi:hypothetical protein